MLMKLWCAVAAKRKKVAASSHSLVKPLHEGVILTDMMKAEWKIGKPVGSGGFGLLYLGELGWFNDRDNDDSWDSDSLICNKQPFEPVLQCFDAVDLGHHPWKKLCFGNFTVV